MAAATEQEYTPIVPGGSLMLAWQVRGKHILVIGGGEVAAGRIVHALNADALVTVIAPRAGLHPEVAHRVKKGQVRHLDREFVDEDLDICYPLREDVEVDELDDGDDGAAAHGAGGDLEEDEDASKSKKPKVSESHAPKHGAGDTEARSHPHHHKHHHHHHHRFRTVITQKIPVSMVFTAIDCPATSSRICNLCHQLRLPVNVADVPPECDFYFGSVYRDGPVQVMVSTNGNGPKMANLIKMMIEKCLSEGLEDEMSEDTAQGGAGRPTGPGKAVERVGELRKKLRTLAPGDEQIGKRMKWISTVSETYSFPQLSKMTDNMIEKLLGHYESGHVPPYEELSRK